MTNQHPVFHFTNAIVRRPSETVVNGLRDDNRGDPDFGRLVLEHENYVDALRSAGVDVEVLPALEAFPDSIFVEDPALVFSEGAILLRANAKSRAGEIAEIAPVLRERFETVLEMSTAGYVDGGDILTTQDHVMIGLSARTDKDGARELQILLERLGRKSKIVATPKGVLHFKTACSLLDEETVLSTEQLAQADVFGDLKTLITPAGEEPAANALRVNDVVMVGIDFPRTIEMLDKQGYQVVSAPTTEIGKIDAGLSCMSLRWRREDRAS